MSHKRFLSRIDTFARLALIHAKRRDLEHAPYRDADEHVAMWDAIKECGEWIKLGRDWHVTQYGAEYNRSQVEDLQKIQESHFCLCLYGTVTEIENLIEVIESV